MDEVIVYHKGGRLLDGLKSPLVKDFIQLQQRNCIDNTILSALTSLLIQSRIVLTNLTKHSNNWKPILIEAAKGDEYKI